MTMTAAATRKRILETALRLFNEFGTAAVSTNRIAADAGISPGNLYYHYRNKEEIIRALLEDLLAAFEVFWLLPHGRQLGLGDLHTLLSNTFEVQWRYRFLSRELVALLRSDHLLAQRYQDNYQRRMQQQRTFAQHLIDARVLRPLREAELTAVLTACWIVTENWLTFLESSGQPITYEQFQAGSQVIARVLHPYLNER
jgi:AcrR family transcriptional regulator